jgi:hypothetical protein
MRPPVGLLDEFLSKKRSKQRVKFYAKPSGYDVVVADTRLNQKAFRLSLLGTGFQNRGLCQICLATDQADNQCSVATSCAVQLHMPLCAVIVSLLTFTIA